MKSFILIFACTLTFGSAHSQEAAEFIKKYLISEYGEKSEFPRRFIYSMTDLNDDGEEEYLIGLIGPDFCGTGGCTMLILHRELKRISTVTLVKYPIYIGSEESSEKTKGYKDVYLRTGQVGYVKLVWTGQKYPGNPSTQPQVPESHVTGKTKFLNAEDDPAYEF